MIVKKNWQVILKNYIGRKNAFDYNKKCDFNDFLLLKLIFLRFGKVLHFWGLISDLRFKSMVTEQLEKEN